MKKKNTVKKIGLKKMMIIQNLKTENQDKVKGGSVTTPISALCSRPPLC